MGVGGRRIQNTVRPQARLERRSGEDRGSSQLEKEGLRWGCRVAEDGENWSYSDRLKPSFPPIVCKYQ